MLILSLVCYIIRDNHMTIFEFLLIIILVVVGGATAWYFSEVALKRLTKQQTTEAEKYAV